MQELCFQAILGHLEVMGYGQLKSYKRNRLSVPKNLLENVTKSEI